MKKFNLIFLFYLSPILWKGNGGELRAQKLQQDSLLLELKKHLQQDLQHLKILNALSAAQFWMINTDAIATADKAIALAQKLNNQEQLAIAYNNKAFPLVTFDIDDANTMALKALDISKTINNKTQIANSYINLAYASYNRGQLEENKLYTQKALEFSEQINNPLLSGKLYMYIGSFYRNNNKDSALLCYKKADEYFKQAGHTDFIAYNLLFTSGTHGTFSVNDSALIYVNRSLELAEQTGSLCNLSNGYALQSSIYLYLANYPLSLDASFKQLKVIEKRKDRFEEAGAYANISYIYCQLKKYKEAMEYAQKGLEVSDAINNPESILYAHQSIGDIFMAQQNFNQALEEYSKGLEVANATNTDSHIAVMHGYVGNAYKKLNQQVLALNSFKKAIALNQKTKNNSLLTRNYISIANTIKNAPANVLTEAGINPLFQQQMAADYYQQALLLNKGSGELEADRDALKGLSEIYNTQKKFDIALDYYKKYVVIKDSIINTESSKSVNNLQIQYDTEKKEQQIVLLNKDKALQQTEIQKQKTTRNSFMGGFALVIMISGVTYNRYRVKQKANKQLAIALGRLKNAQQQLIQQEKLASAGQLTAGIAHEIQNPLNFVINFSELSSDLVQEIEQASTANEKAALLTELEDNIRKIERHRNRADGIVQSMLQHSRNDVSQKQFENINELCADAVNLSVQTSHIKYPHIKIDLQTNYCTPPALANVVKQEIVNVVLNILNNASYAVNEKKNAPGTNSNYQPEINLTTSATEKFVSIEITDNGTGISEKIKTKIFQPFFTTKPTNQGTGLGLSLSYDIIKAHGGEMIVESIPNESTTFTIKLPL